VELLHNRTLTLIGTNFSDLIRPEDLSIKKEKLLMSQMVKILKVLQLELLTLKISHNKSGTSFTKIPLMTATNQNPEILMEKEDFTTQDHSILPQECGWKESLPSITETTWSLLLEPTTKIKKRPDNGLTIKYLRPLDPFLNQRLQLMSDLLMLMPGNPTHYGTKCSNMRMVTLSTKKERFLVYKARSTKRTDKFNP
jgi:hypothetical protein